MNKGSHCCQLRRQESMPGFEWYLWAGRVREWATGMIHPERGEDKYTGMLQRTEAYIRIKILEGRFVV